MPHRGLVIRTATKQFLNLPKQQIAPTFNNNQKRLKGNQTTEQNADQPGHKTQQHHSQKPKPQNSPIPKQSSRNPNKRQATQPTKRNKEPAVWQVYILKPYISIVQDHHQILFLSLQFMHQLIGASVVKDHHQTLSFLQHNA